VRILSIHRAKGLEFPVVALADLHREHPAPEGPSFLGEWLSGRVGYRCGRLRTRAWIAADERYRRAQEEEERRLLYVALTRAKERILLTGGRSDKGFLGMIVSALTQAGLEVGDADQQVLRGDDFEVGVRLHGRIEAPWTSGARSVGGDEPDYESENRRWKERARERRQIARTPLLRRPSAPTGSAPEDEDQREGTDLDRVIRLESGDETVDAMSVGSRCHDLLAEVDLGDPGCSGADESVRPILEAFFQTEAFREIQRAERVYREVPFLIEFDGESWSGQIDLLYRLEGRWIVADYKSDRREEPQRYRVQARVYAQAAQRALGLAEPPEFRLIYLRTGRVFRQVDQTAG
jgi:ATP-dependent helicase/nuclease subunit A